MPSAISHIAISVHRCEGKAQTISIKRLCRVVINLYKAIIFACSFLIVRPCIVNRFNDKVIRSRGCQLQVYFLFFVWLKLYARCCCREKHIFGSLLTCYFGILFGRNGIGCRYVIHVYRQIRQHHVGIECGLIGSFLTCTGVFQRDNHFLGLSLFESLVNLNIQFHRST